MSLIRKISDWEGLPESEEAPFRIDTKRVSPFTKLCKVTACVLRFIKQLRKQTGLSVSLKISGLSNAEILLTAFVQSTAYCSVISWFITMVST